MELPKYPITKIEYGSPASSTLFNDILGEIDQNLEAVRDWIDTQTSSDIDENINTLKELIDAFQGIDEGETIANLVGQINQLLETVKPHAIPEYAYPFIDGIDGDPAAFAALSDHPEMSGVKVDSSGKMRFWTTIRGRKPIVAPIGGYAGMDRFDLDSLQLLDDEFGPNGEPVYSVDGRDWVRFIGSFANPTVNDTWGQRAYFSDADDDTNYYEFTGFFDSYSILRGVHVNRSDGHNVKDNGVTVTDSTDYRPVVSSPLTGRYLDSGSLFPGVSLSLGMHTIEITPTDSDSSGNNCDVYGIELGIDSDKVTIPSQTCIAQGKKYDIAFNNSLDHKPNVWAANYGKVGYDGEHDQGLSAWGFGEDVRIAVSDHDANTTQYSGTPLNVFDWVLDTTLMQAFQVQNPFKVSGIHQAVNGSTQVNWGTGQAYTAFPATGGSVTAGNLYYYASGNKLYKCIVSGVVTYASQTDIEDSGLFAYRIPTNGYRTAFITHGLINIGLGRNFVRATRWLPPAARHIGDSAIDERSSGQQRPVLEAGDVDFDGQELVKVINNREFGNGDKNGDTATGVDTMPATGSHDRAFVLDDGLTALVCDDMYCNIEYGYGLTPQGTDDFYTLTFIGTGLRLKYFDSVTSNAIHEDSIISDLPFGAHTLQFKYNSSSTIIIIDNVEVATISRKWMAGIDFYLYSEKAPDLPEGSHILCEYMGMADAVSPTESGVLAIGKGARRVSSSRDFFYDQSVSGGTDWSIFVNPGYFNGHMVWGGNSAKTMTAKLPFFGEQVGVALGTSIDSADIVLYIDDLLVTPTNFPDVTVIVTEGTFTPSIATFSHTAGAYLHITIAGLLKGNYILKIVSTAAVATYIRLGGADLYPGIHRSNHYSKLTYNPYVSPELVGGGDGINNDNLIVSGDGKILEDARRPNKETFNPSLIIGHCDGTVAGQQYFDNVRGDHWTVRDAFIVCAGGYICRIDGEYEFSFYGGKNGSAGWNEWRLNGSNWIQRYIVANEEIDYSFKVRLKKGDVIYVSLDQGFDASMAFSIAPRIHATLINYKAEK